MANVYNVAPMLKMHRSKFDRKYSHKTTLPFGKLVPIGMPQEVLPGDTWKLDLANVTRMLTPIAPIMDDISLDVYGFFCPYRILMSTAKQFFGENDQVAWTLKQDKKLPFISFDIGDLFPDGLIGTDPTNEYAYLVTEDDYSKVESFLKSGFAGSLCDYFGLPFVYPNLDLLQKWFDGDLDTVVSINALPFLAYQMIYNEFFRNENVTDPVLALNYDGNDINLNGVLDFEVFKVRSVARWKDLFTSLLPAPQRGPAVQLPIGATAKLTVGDMYSVGTGKEIGFGSSALIPDHDDAFGLFIGSKGAGQSMYANPTASTIDDTTWKSINETNLLADLSTATMATVNQIRYAFAVQRYYEKLARGGARYNEYLEVMFGVRPSDATLQRPQYLGGKHVHINVQQVLQTSESDTTPLGSTGAYSCSGFNDHLYTNSFTEHGIILNFVVIRKEHTYCQGMDKFWTKRDVLDIYNPTFAHIGEVPVMRNEVYWIPDDDTVLGYNEAWYEYRSQASKATAGLSPLAPNSLRGFVLTDVFETAPVLDDNFIFEDAGGLDRALVAEAKVTDQFLADFYFQYTLSRVMPVHSIPGLIDHY